MSLQAMAWAREAMPSLPVAIKAGPRLLLMLMADYANEQGVCWPSIRRLSAEMACSMRTVQRSIEALVEQELMEVVPRQTKTGRQTSNFYRLAMGVTQQQQAADEPSLEELEALMAGSDEEASAKPAAAPAEHPIFANAAQQDDRGQPAQGTGGARQIAMTLDWEPEATHWQTETLRRGDPSLTWDRGELADFTAHFADKPTRTNSSHAWCAKFARWVSDNRKRQAAQQARTDQNNAKNNARTAGGSTHASHRPTGPVRNAAMSAAEGRVYLEQQRRQAQAGDAPGGDILDGEWSS
ncbi:DnaT-like ssDNA-binding domain-containing protein [Cobetia amphilecti]|uniref:DnaT-like ssDNA-binding domain-containing protein n=1 Tax=Cobetia amphilecti TaxID=1055104 RepID=UPI00069346C8|nr:DnaT-like ssDNA-binding domain-containing protein [Cobetia amphilecti]